MRRKQPYIIIIALSFLLLGTLVVNDAPSTLSEIIADNEKIKLLDPPQDLEFVEEINYIEEIESFENLEAVEETSITSLENTLTGFLGGFAQYKISSEVIQYSINSFHMSLRFGEGEIQFLIRDSIPQDVDFSDPSSIPPEYFTHFQTEDYTQATLSFVGCNPVIPVGKNAIEEGFLSYYPESGEYPASNPMYSKLIYHNLYPHIDLIYEIREGLLKYEFFVYPGGNIDDIQLRWEGPVSLELLSAGMEISVTTAYGSFTLIDSTPICYQNFDRTEPIMGFFNLIDSQTYGFLVSSYDPEQLLIIDPVIREV